MIRLITDYLERIHEEVKDKSAFVSPAISLSFAAFREKARICASAIIKRRIFREPVAILIPDSVEAIVALTGVAYSGNYYAPIDPELPVERIEKILNILNPVLIISQEEYMDKLSSMSRPLAEIEKISYSEIISGMVDEKAISNTQRGITDADLLYVLFTSGSTGIPKGVAVSHRNAIFMTENHTKHFRLNADTVFGNCFPVFFAASVITIFTTFKNGSTCCLGLSRLYLNKEKFRDYLSDCRINTLTGMPATFQLFGRAGTIIDGNGDILKIVLGGDRITVADAKQLMRYFPESTILAGYGATEIGGYAFGFNVNEWLMLKKRTDNEVLPMGRPFNNIDVLLIDDSGKQVFGNGEGEMFLRFSAIPYGYYRNEEKTSEAYVSNPLQHYYPETVFKSNDIVSLDEEGFYIHRGRQDFLIKKRGFRIELGDIETCALSHKMINQSCAIYLNEIQKIVLFYSGSVNDWELVKHIKNKLPAYMLPDRIIKLETIPINTNGKYDRAKLKLQAEHMM